MMNPIFIVTVATALFGICLGGNVRADGIDYNVGVHYYPWYYNDFHGRHYLREHLVPPQLPKLGEYNDRDEAVINRHLKWCRDAGVNFWSASWWGPGSREDTTLLNYILQNPNPGGLKIAILYETVGRTNDFQDYSNLGPDIAYLADNYFAHPNYLKIDGKPVVVVYLTRVLSFFGTLESSLAVMREAATDMGYQLYIVGDQVFGEPPTSPGDIALLDAIINYDAYGSMGATNYAGQAKVDEYYTAQAGWKALAESVGTDYAPAVCPGFNDRGVREGHDPLSRKLTQDDEFGSLFRAMLQGAKTLTDPDIGHMILVTSWNEWHEDTQIEPVQAAPPTSVDDSFTGHDYTNGLAYEGYDTRYLDILREETFPHEYHHFTLTAPDGGEILPSGSTYTIKWIGPPDMVSFNLKYSLNNGRKWKVIAEGLKGNDHGWTVPTPRKNKKKCLMKVIGYDDSGAKVGADTSDAPFTIALVEVTSPSEGETLISGIPYTIEWDTYGTKRPVEKVKLLYTKNGGRTWNKIETLEGNPGFYDWLVPDVAKTKSKCLVKVVLKDANGKTVGSDTSDSYFTIQP